METEKEVMENKGKIRMNELKIEALLNLLSNEGVLSHADFERELKELVGKSK
ncbi:MAG: hypothetical protein GY861_06985 [bacterium]|nr:hypothetical protein [bacterium]